MDWMLMILFFSSFFYEALGNLWIPDVFYSH